METGYIDFPIYATDVESSDCADIKVDDENHITYIKFIDGLEYWYTYEEGLLVKFVSSCGYCEHREYNEDGLIIHYYNADGIEFRCEYDEYGNVTHYSDPNGYDEYYGYDECGNITYYRNSVGFEEWNDYDEYGRIIAHTNSDGVEELYRIGSNRHSTLIKRDVFNSYNEYHVCGMHIVGISNSIYDPYDPAQQIEYDPAGNPVYDENTENFRSYYRWYMYDNKYRLREMNRRRR